MTHTGKGFYMSKNTTPKGSKKGPATKKAGKYAELLNWIGLTGAVGETRPLFVENDGGSGYAVWDLEGGRK